MSGEEKGRHHPDGKEDSTESSVKSATSKKALEGNTSRNEVEACTGEVATINNQPSDDSLEDDGVTDNPIANPVARDRKVDTGRDETNAVTEINASVLNSQSKENVVLNGRVITEGGAQSSNGGSNVTPELSNQYVANKSDNVSKVTASQGSLQSKSSQLSSRLSNSSSKIPILKGSKGAKPSPLVDLHKPSTNSVTMTASGEFPQQEVNSPALQASEDTDTPVSVALRQIPSRDSLHRDVDEVGVTRKEMSFANKQNEAVATTLVYHSSQKRPSQLPVSVRRRQDGRVLKNSNSFNSYVHEQMAITMAMMEANFEGVGLSNTQQERVEELRAGLDSFSLTSITVPEQKKTILKNGRHHHDNHDYGSHRDKWLSDHQMHNDAGYHRTRAPHDGEIQLLYRSQSYSTNPNHISYGSNKHSQRRGSQLSHSDSFTMKRSGSYVQQQLDRRGSYLQHSKLGQSIKSLRPPKLKPLPRKRSSNNYLDNYMKSNSNRSGAAGRIGNRQWSPAHVMPPLDESTPISHAHYWNPTVNTLGSHMISDGSYGDGYYHNKQHNYPVLPNIGESYSSISLHRMKPYNSYQQHCPGPPRTDATHPGAHYYMQHDYRRHRN